MKVLMKRVSKAVQRLLLRLLGYEVKPSLAAQRRAVNYRWKKRLQATR
jgi:hypothetical protein